MIVKNEETCLAKCLRSVVGADELVVVDTGSKDRTKEIAAEFGARLFEFAWCDDFSAARNYALDRCTGDWILSIDADNELEPGGIEKIRAAIEGAGDFKTVGIKISTRGHSHVFPLLFRRCPEVRWRGAIHNYLSVSENNPSDITIEAGYSKAHAGDPDRALRVLKKELEKNPKAVRETYYLAREYWYRKDYETAAKWYRDYLTRAFWSPEIADAYLMLARCLWQLHRGEEARDACLGAIKHNADFKEALLFMSEMSGPKNRERWKLFAEFAKNEDVLFVRDSLPRAAAYYDKLFAASKDMSRYRNLLQAAAAWTHGRVLDVCCGTGELGNYVESYSGIDFSAEAVRGQARCRQGDVFAEDLSGFDCYAILEALEHVDDLALLRRIPAGADLVLSVPSFPDPSHVRTFNEKILRVRYAELLQIREVVRFNWTGREWDRSHPATSAYILLARARRREGERP